MTFNVDFYAEQAFLAFVKRSVSTEIVDHALMVQTGAVSVLACAAALEAMVNSLFKQDGRFPHFDELRLTSKIDTIGHLTGKTIDWGVQPWQDIARLIMVRNWLAHYKDPYIGLVAGGDYIGVKGGWVRDDVHKPPKLDPFQELSSASVERFYIATRQGLKMLALDLGIEPSVVEFLDTENYEPFQIG